MPAGGKNCPERTAYVKGEWLLLEESGSLGAWAGPGWQVKELIFRIKSRVRARRLSAGGGIRRKVHNLLVCRTGWRDGNLSQENQLGTTAKV